jgi:aminopeptidase-like protein
MKNLEKYVRLQMKYNELNKIFNELWPIARSITGPGFTKSLELIKRYIPLETKKIKSGTKVFDWVVPPEWKLNLAYLKDQKGKKILSTKDNNLHVMNFSQPFSGTINYDKLEKHLYTIPEIPSAIPYVTSYYDKRWGLCMSHQKKVKLNKKKKYTVKIDTEVYGGFLRYGEFTLKGRSKQTILLTSYLCHPSLANNELSGPLVMLLLYEKLKNQKNYFTYKFLIIPETIGSISYLSKTKKKDLDKIYAGIVLTCLGGPKSDISFKHSRRHWLGEKTQIDYIIELLCKFDKGFAQRSFTPTDGSDERQFCSPSINLPFIQAARTIYDEYEGYHNSLDDKKFMNLKRIIDSADKINLLIKSIELDALTLKPLLKGGEPMLSKRNLYPSINSHGSRNSSSNKLNDNRKYLNTLLEVYSLIDGKNSLSDIILFLKKPFNEIVPIIEKLIDEKIIKKT